MAAVTRPVPHPGDVRQAGAGVSSGQLTYTSFDTGTGIGGGWQVKQASQALDPADLDFLRSRVSTSLTPVDPLPQFPTPEQVEARARRLMYAPVDAVRGAYWHTVPAGADSSGRPGNVFAHTYLDAELPAAQHRPIDRWRSPDWLVPYGARDVLAAEFAPHAPRPGDVVTRDTVIDFLLDPAVWRVSLFSVLLDATVKALNNGPAVVFGAESVESAAMWIGAVSHVLSTTAARRLAWSTFDRAPAVPAVLSQGVHLIAVPLGDLAELEPSDRYVVLAETDEPSRGEFDGQPNLTNSGAQIPVTRLSQIAEVLLIDADVVRRVLQNRDSVVERVSDAGAGAAWALAMAIELEHDEELSDAAEDCADAIGMFLPPGLLEHPELFAAASVAVARKTGTSPADALAALTQHRRPGTAPSVVAAMTLRVYLERALSDREWLMTAPATQFDAPPSGWAPPELAAVVEARIDEILRECDASEPDSPQAEDLAVLALKLTDLLARARVIGAWSPDVVEKLQQIVERTVPTLFFDDSRVLHFVGRVGKLDAAACRLVLQPVIVSLPGMNHRSVGSRLRPECLAWAMPYTLAPRPLERILEESGVDRFDPEQILSTERMVSALYRTPIDPAASAQRPQCLAQFLQSGKLDPQLAHVFFARPGWPARDLTAVMDRFGDRLPSAAAWWTVLEAPRDQHLEALMNRVVPQGDPVGADPIGDPAGDRLPGDARARHDTPPSGPDAEPMLYGAGLPGSDHRPQAYPVPETYPVPQTSPVPRTYPATRTPPMLVKQPVPDRSGAAAGPVPHAGAASSPRQQALHQLVRLRRITAWDTVDRHTVQHGFTALVAQLATGRDALTADVYDALPTDLLVNLTVLQVAQRIVSRRRAPVSSWGSPQAPPRLPLPDLDRRTLDQVGDALVDLCRSGALEANEVADAAFLVSPEGPGFDLAETEEKDLGEFGSTAGEQPTSLLDRVVDVLVAEQHPVWADGPDPLPHSVVVALEARHRYDEVPGSYRKFARKWLEARGVDSGSGLKSLFRRRG